MDQRIDGLRSFPPAPPRRRLSQNFLVDPRVAEHIVTLFAPLAADHVVEVGSGRGALTERVALRVARLTAIEVDRRLAEALGVRLAGIPGLEIRLADALRIPLASLSHGARFRILANLPYHISSPMVLKLLDEIDQFTDATILLQLEFARRLAAGPGSREYGSISVLVQARSSVTPLLDVRPEAFRPRPEVHSRLLRLCPLPRPLAEPAIWPVLKALLRAGFSARRKVLVNSLAAGLGAGREEVEQALHEAGADARTRPETIPPALWVELARGRLGRLARTAAASASGPGDRGDQQ